MSSEPTIALLDNTTFAAAGRALYRHTNTPGGEHARAYQASYNDAALSDWYSLGELLTALVLFDQLRWDGASFTQEYENMMHTDISGQTPWEKAWLYDWFPKFKSLRDDTIIDHLPPDSLFNAISRHSKSMVGAVRWVKERVATGQFSLPAGFRVPLSYNKSHKDYPQFEEINNRFKLTEMNLQISMFLHRGLFYESRIWSSEFDTYIPHGYRGCMLQDPSTVLISAICDYDKLYQLTKPQPLSGDEILSKIDAGFFEELAHAVKIAPMPVGAAIGMSFLQRPRKKVVEAKEALEAVDRVIEFRKTPHGKEVREEFRALLNLGQVSDKQGIERRITDLRRRLRDVAIKQSGGKFDEDKHFLALCDLAGPFKELLKAATLVMPVAWQEAMERFLHQQVTRGGFQVLFSQYMN